MKSNTIDQPPQVKKDSLPKRRPGPFRVSLRYKLAFPVLIFVLLMFFLLFYTTFQLVRALVVDGIEERLKSVTNVFTETVKVPLLSGNNQDIQSIAQWMGSQQHVFAVRVEDASGQLLGSFNPGAQFPDAALKPEFLGALRISSDVFAIARPVQDEEQVFGRAVVLFSHLGIEEALKEIFRERLQMAFIMMILLALLTSAITWIGIRPLFSLEKAAKRVLSGDLDARADVHSFDEIEDVGIAFNEMMSRLSTSLDRLRYRTEELEESEEKYRLVVENASDIIFTLTREGDVTLLNREFSGATREELLREGLPLILMLHDAESRKQFQEALEIVMTRKHPIDNVSVKHFARGTKTEIFYLVNLTPIIGTDGEVKSIQGVMRDVTELRRIEMMKDSLIRDVAHELKTPVAKFDMAINWFAKEMEKRKEIDRYREIMEILRNNSARLMHTITSILDLSRLESGLEQITRIDLDLNEILDQVFKDMEPLVKMKGLQLSFERWRTSLIIRGDGHMLYRVFVNLIQNAMKFTKTGKIILRSFVREGEIHLEVQDTGIGIEPNSLEIIFERFVQKTAASSGIGVGLTICRDIVALHNGKIWATSLGLGHGSVFHVTFPPEKTVV